MAYSGHISSHAPGVIKFCFMNNNMQFDLGLLKMDIQKPLLSSIGNVMFPKVAQLHSQQKADQAYGTFKRLILIYTPFVVVGIIVIIPVTEPLIRLLIPQFLPATKIIIVQTITALFFGYFAIGVNYATAAGKLRIATILNWFLSLIFLILAFYLTGSTK